MEIVDGFSWGSANSPDSRNLYLRTALERDLRIRMSETIPTEPALAATLDALAWEALGEWHQSQRQSAVVTTDGAVVWLLWDTPRRELYIEVAGISRDVAAEVLARVRDHTRPPETSDESSVTVSFWSNGTSGPARTDRQIATTGWAEVVGNYSAATADHVDQLMGLRPPIEGGRLILWHGAPGTGKTHALRALAQQWRSWCSVDYIVDPDSLFGSAAYLLRVLLDTRPVPSLGPEVGFRADDRDRIGAGVDHWRLLVVEDADEFLRADAKDRTGQALSRLLNTADGLIGQGLNIMVLISTNEHLSRVHPAVARPGRCLANIEFTGLTANEARAWLAAHEAPSTSSGEQTLAELYNQLRTTRQITTATAARPTPQYL